MAPSGSPGPDDAFRFVANDVSRWRIATLFSRSSDSVGSRSASPVLKALRRTSPDEGRRLLSESRSPPPRSSWHPQGSQEGQNMRGVDSPQIPSAALVRSPKVRPPAVDQWFDDLRPLNEREAISPTGQKIPVPPKADQAVIQMVTSSPSNTSSPELPSEETDWNFATEAPMQAPLQPLLMCEPLGNLNAGHRDITSPRAHHMGILQAEIPQFPQFPSETHLTPAQPTLPRHETVPSQYPAVVPGENIAPDWTSPRCPVPGQEPWPFPMQQVGQVGPEAPSLMGLPVPHWAGLQAPPMPGSFPPQGHGNAADAGWYPRTIPVIPPNIAESRGPQPMQFNGLPMAPKPVPTPHGLVAPPLGHPQFLMKPQGLTVPCLTPSAPPPGMMYQYPPSVAGFGSQSTPQQRPHSTPRQRIPQQVLVQGGHPESPRIPSPRSRTVQRQSSQSTQRPQVLREWTESPRSWSSRSVSPRDLPPPTTPPVPPMPAVLQPGSPASKGKYEFTPASAQHHTSSPAHFVNQGYPPSPPIQSVGFAVSQYDNADGDTANRNAGNNVDGDTANRSTDRQDGWLMRGTFVQSTLSRPSVVRTYGEFISRAVVLADATGAFGGPWKAPSVPPLKEVLQAAFDRQQLSVALGRLRRNAKSPAFAKDCKDEERGPRWVLSRWWGPSSAILPEVHRQRAICRLQSLSRRIGGPLGSPLVGLESTPEAHNLWVSLLADFLMSQVYES